MSLNVLEIVFFIFVIGLLILMVRLLVISNRRELIVNVKIDKNELYPKKYYEYRSILLKMDDEIPNEFNGSDWELIAAVLNDSPYAQKQARYTFRRIVPIENKQENKNTKIKYYYQ